MLQPYGLDERSVWRIIAKCPEISSLPTETLRERLEWLEGDEVGVSRDKMGGMVARYPSLLAHSADANLRPTVQHLQDEVGVSRDKMGGMVANHPSLLSLGVVANLRPTMQYLQDEVGVSRYKMGGMVAKHPQLLACSVDDNLRPTVR